LWKNIFLGIYAMTDIDIEQYRITEEPFYEAQDDEVALYEAAYAARLPVMIKGPTGCGKSRFIEHMAWKLGKPIITVACNEEYDCFRFGRSLLIRC